MASIWFWILSGFIGLIVGTITILATYLFFTFLMDKLIFKRGIPKKKALVSQHIKDNKEKYLSPGNPNEITDTKEVIDDERRRKEKFREFDKLRNEYFRATTGRATENNRDVEGSVQLPTRELLQNDANTDTTRNTNRPTDNRRSVRLE